MRALLAVLLALLVAQPTFAQTITNPPPSAGNVPGQPGGGLASVGSLGEFVSVSNNAASAAATLSNGTPTVVTAANTFPSRCITSPGSTALCVFAINFTGLAGAAGVTNTTPYYVCTPDLSAATFHIATSVANCLAGTFVATTGTDSGTVLAEDYQATSGVGQPVLALTLPAGDWDCSGNVAIFGVASTATTIAAAGLSTSASAILNGDGSASRLTTTFTTGATTNALPVGPLRFSQAAPVTVNLLLNLTWTGGATSPIATGTERCRRAG